MCIRARVCARGYNKVDNIVMMHEHYTADVWNSYGQGGWCSIVSLHAITAKQEKGII